MYSATRASLTSLRATGVSASISYRTLHQAAPAAAQANELSSKRRRVPAQPADPHTSTFASAQPPSEVRTLKTTQESTQAAAEVRARKPLDRFGFKALKDGLRNYVAGPLYAH